MQVVASGQRDDFVAFDVFQQILQRRSFGGCLRGTVVGDESEHGKAVGITDSAQIRGVVSDPGRLISDSLVAKIPAHHQAHAFTFLRRVGVTVGFTEPGGHHKCGADDSGDGEQPKHIDAS